MIWIFDLDNAPIMWNGSYVNPHSAPLTPRLFSRCFSIFNLFCLGCARAHDFPVSVCSRRLCFFTDVAWSTRRTLPAQHPKERENRELTFNRWTHTKTHVLTLLCVCHHIYFKADVLKLKMFVFFLMLWASQTTFYSLVLRWRRKSCNIICNILKLGTKKPPQLFGVICAASVIRVNRPITMEKAQVGELAAEDQRVWDSRRNLLPSCRLRPDPPGTWARVCQSPRPGLGTVYKLDCFNRSHIETRSLVMGNMS